MGAHHGRNSVLAVKKYGESTYTAVADIEDFSGFGFTRAVNPKDVYSATAIPKNFDPAIDLKVGTIRGFFDPTEVTHDDDTGLLKWAATDEATTIEMRGPNYSAPSTDVVRMSGQVTDFTWLMPKDDNIRFEVQFTPDGTDLMIDGDIKVTQTI